MFSFAFDLQTYEGGFGLNPGLEAHGALRFAVLRVIASFFVSQLVGCCRWVNVLCACVLVVDGKAG